MVMDDPASTWFSLSLILAVVPYTTDSLKDNTEQNGAVQFNQKKIGQ